MARNNRNEDEFVVWDGARERDFSHEARGHDCIVSSDGHLISVQKLRRQWLDAGKEVVLIFACAPFKPAFEMRAADKPNSIFTFCWVASVGSQDGVTLREAVTRTNACMKRKGFDQNCEVVCRPEMLDLPVWDLHREDRATIVMLLDMCRTLHPGVVGPAKVKKP